MLFLDDGAFVCESWNDLVKGLEIIKHVFDYFGLEMHLGKGETKTKTECVYFPKPSFYQPPPALPPVLAEEEAPLTTKQKSHR